MLVEFYFPQSLSQARLDRYLAGGWFRSGPSMFRAQVLCLGGGVYSVVNIRIPLERYALSRSLRRIRRRNDPQFRIEIGQVMVDERREALYQHHKSRFKGFIFDTLEEFLYAGQSYLLFDTRELRVFDGDTLVAVSYFDTGKLGLASLLGLYDPAYARNSMGIYTMLQEIQYAQDQGMRYYYPGYVLQGYDGFSYKLRLGHAQYYNWQGRWRPMERLGEEVFVVEQLEQQLKQLAEALQANGVPFSHHYYPFFTIGYLGMADEDFMRCVAYLSCYPGQLSDDRLLIVEYVAEDQLFTLSLAYSTDAYREYMTAEFSEDAFEEGAFMTDLLVREEILFWDRNPHRVVKHLIAFFETWEDAA